MAAAAAGGGGAGGLYIAAGILALFFGYFFIFWDRRKEDSAFKDDEQSLLKLVLFALIFAGLGIAAGGVVELLGWLFGGAKGGSGPLKSGLAAIIAGGAAVAVIYFVFLPRTNFKEHTKAEQYALGFLALFAGIEAFDSLHSLLDGLFTSAGWANTANYLVSAIVHGGVAFLAMMRFGKLSGWVEPVRAAPMAPPGGGYPPQQGFPPQQQGYPPQQGGYPPQGGSAPQGYPPQGGGAPGGGYPPQGGGGLPPPSGSGGGYPPGGYQPR